MTQERAYTQRSRGFQNQKRYKREKPAGARSVKNGLMYGDVYTLQYILFQ